MILYTIQYKNYLDSIYILLDIISDIKLFHVYKKIYLCYTLILWSFTQGTWESADLGNHREGVVPEIVPMGTKEWLYNSL